MSDKREAQIKALDDYDRTNVEDRRGESILARVARRVLPQPALPPIAPPSYVPPGMQPSMIDSMDRVGPPSPYLPPKDVPREPDIWDRISALIKRSR